MKRINLDHLIPEYLAGKTIAELSRQYNVFTGTIRGWFRSRNVKLRTRSEVAHSFHSGDRVCLEDSIVTAIIKDYLTGQSPDELALKYKVGRMIVYRELRRAKVLRNLSDTRRMQWERMTEAE